MPRKNLDELDQQLVEAILTLDVEGVKKALQAGANVVHKRKRDGYPIGPSMTPVILSHRMKDLILAKHEFHEMRRVPEKVVACLKQSVAECTESIGEEEVQSRVEDICKMIAKKLGLPKI
ncbi:MAG: hypothetical protein KDA84_09715 [Planctomycetaceae bacterium]|nr:hypothetical protein [Planctomycetaceae bacterium]